MESKFSTETIEFGTVPSVNVSRSMVGGISGQGGGTAEFANIVSCWMEVEHVGQKTLRPINPGTVKQSGQQLARSPDKGGVS
jgi:hypothetical protein